MPLYPVACLHGHTRDVFCHVAADLGTATPLCPCGSTMAVTVGFGRGLTWFEEGRGRWISHLADQPIYVTSHAQHTRLMREHGVTWATRGRRDRWI